MPKITQHSIENIIDNLHSAVVVINQDLVIEYMNPSAEMLFQISDTRSKGQSLSNLVIDEFEFLDRIERSLRSHHPFSMYEAELCIRTGQTLTLDYMTSPIEYRSTGQYLLLEFISQGRLRKRVEGEHLLSQNEASRSLLRGLAHEIKNPLGGLRGAAQLLERELETEDDKEYTRIIIREADRLQSLVDRMLGPRDVPNKDTLNIHKILEHVRQLVQVENDTVKFIIDYDPSLPDIVGDESMLIQAVLNITRNAVAEVETDGEVIFRTRPLRNYTIGKNTYPLVAKIDIIDNGPGIPDELKEKIFLPMITGRAEGTGLGLSIAQTLVNQHDGLIECESIPGKTTFTLLLPINNVTGNKTE
jgi:two-component system nitrogen regulation sensor histidine kinase GlnL